MHSRMSDEISMKIPGIFPSQLVARDVVRMQHLPGKIMVADLLTKAVARALFASLMDLIRQYAESGVACPST